MNFEDKVWCVMCGTDVPPERKAKRSVTCSENCSKKRKLYLRQRKEMSKCKYCHAPSTLEERKEFLQWRRERRKQGASSKNTE